MSVLIPFPIRNVEQEKEQTSRTYRLDFERGRIFAAGSCDGMAAAQQAIKKALLTPRFRCRIYDNQYGSELKQTIIAGDATREFVETELPRQVRDALSVDTRLLESYDFSLSFDGEAVAIGFTENTIFGTAAVEEVI